MRGLRKRRKFRLVRWRSPYLWLMVVILLFGVLLYWFDQSLQPALRQVATIRLKQMATHAINKAITEQVAQSDTFSDLMEWKLDAAGNINGAVFNQKAHAGMTAECIRVVEQTLDQLQRMPQQVPLGMLLDSSLLMHFGPQMELTMMPAGIVRAQMGSQWKEAGINTMMLEIYVDVSAEVRVLVGFDSASATIQTRIPLTYAVINGQIPQYYMKQSPTGQNQLPGTLLMPPKSGQSSNVE